MVRFRGLFQKLVIIALSSLFMCSSYSFAEQAWQEEGTDLVARITVIEGRLERFDPETNEWMIMVPDAPVGVDDQIFAGVDARVEILIPNNTILRIGEETEARFVSLSEKLTEIGLFSGMARLCNISSQTDIVAETPFGRVAVPPGASADLRIDDQSVEIISLDDSVYFTIGTASAIRHEIIAGSASLLAYADRIIPSSGSADRNWNSWNQGRDILWAERRQFSGESQNYLPMPLRNETYVLDTCGSWQRVHYQGAYYRFWRPRNVGFGWAPFTVGRWMNWRGDRVWIPREPFGYVTHHYGNWIYTMNAWYWAPPVSFTMARPGLPLLKIGFGWYPGRVAWINAGVQMSWIPLAPFEPYYCRYPWGLRTIVISNGSYHHYAASHKFKYHRHTIRGHRDHFYRNKRGSHVSRWRTGGRTSAHSSLAPGNKRQTEVGSIRNKRGEKDGNRIRGDGKLETSLTRSRQKNSETRIKKDHDERVAGQGRNSYGASLRTGTRKSSVGVGRSTVKTQPEKKRQSKRQTTERVSTQLKVQNRPSQSTGNIQQSKSQNRSDRSRTGKNEFRKDQPDRVKGQARNRSGSEIKKADHKSTTGLNSGTIATLPEKSRQFNGQAAKRQGNQLKAQNQLPRSSGNFRQPEVQNRSGVARTEENAFRKGDRTRLIR